MSEAGGNPATYRQNGPAVAAKMRKRLIITSITMMLLMAGMAWYFGGSIPPERRLIFGVFLVVVVGFSIVNGQRRVGAIARSLELSVSDDDLILRRNSMPEIRVSRADITAIEELPGDGLQIKSSSAMNTFVIPDTLEGYSAVRDRLAGWMAITARPAKAGIWMAITLISLLAAMAAMAAVMTSQQPFVVIPLALILLGLFAWYFRFVSKSPHVAQRLRKTRWILLFPMFGMVVRIIAVLLLRSPQ